MTNEELKDILEKHRKWINGEEGGEIADLRRENLITKTLENVDLTNANISYADLRCVILQNTKLKNAILNNTKINCAFILNTNLQNANLKHAELKYTHLIDVDLTNANLTNADLKDGFLNNTNLTNVDLTDVDLRFAKLHNTNLTNARLTGVISSNISNKRIIAVQVNTSRENNLISYWYDLGIVTTGCFQGTLDELKERVEITHEDNDTLRNRYYRAIQFIEDTIKDYDEELEGVKNEKKK